MGFPKGVKRDFEALEQRRFQAAELLSQGFNNSEVARRLKVSNQTVSRWAARIRHQGLESLRQAGRAGRKPLLIQKDRKRLEQLLKRGPEQLGYETSLWTSERVAHLIENEFGIRYHPGHVWKILVGLGWSCQRPVGRARERNEEAIRLWKKQTWPAIKKKRAHRGVRSSSSMKAG